MTNRERHKETLDRLQRGIWVDKNNKGFMICDPEELERALDEEWADIPNWPDYQASKWGRFRSCKSGIFRILHPTVSDTGYLTIALSQAGKTKTLLAHRLILETFVGPQPDGQEASHINGDRKDNAASNLRWETRKENAAMRFIHGTDLPGEKTHLTKLTANQAAEIYIRARAGERNIDLAKEFNISKSTIKEIKAGRVWKKAIRALPIEGE